MHSSRLEHAIHNVELVFGIAKPLPTDMLLLTIGMGTTYEAETRCLRERNSRNVSASL
jgi:hypothetical protein